MNVILYIRRAVGLVAWVLFPCVLLLDYIFIRGDKLITRCIKLTAAWRSLFWTQKRGEG